jgi:hypothetical protein
LKKTELEKTPTKKKWLRKKLGHYCINKKKNKY